MPGIFGKSYQERKGSWGSDPQPGDSKRRHSRWSWVSRDVPDAAIDAAIRQGKNPRRVFGGKIKGMAPEEARKVERRIRDRLDKAAQGKKGKDGGGGKKK